MTISFIPAICPKCGGELRVPEDRISIKCMYCGCDIIMHETKNNSPQPSIENWLKLADSVKLSNPEEAYGHYAKVLEFEPENWKAWYGRGITGCRLSTLKEPRFTEVTNDFDKALEYSPNNEKEKLEETIVNELLVLGATYITRSCAFYDGEKSLDQYFLLLKRIKFYFLFIYRCLHDFPKHEMYKRAIESNITICENFIENIPRVLTFDPNNPKEYFLDQLLIYVNMIREIDPEYKSKFYERKT